MATQTGYNEWIEQSQQERAGAHDERLGKSAVLPGAEVPPSFSEDTLFYPNVEAYATAQTSEATEDLKRVMTVTDDEKMFAPCMVGQLEGQFLKMFARSSKAKRILDVGTFTGYSALSFAEGLPANGLVVTLESDPKIFQVASKNFQKSQQKDKISARFGNAKETMEQLLAAGEKFDIIFLDADKENYIAYYDIAMKGLLADGGTIMADNCLCALVYREGDMRRQKIHEFNEYVRKDPRVEQSVLTVREGITMIQLIDSAKSFEIKLNISNHPCSWGVDYADCPTNPPWQDVIRCIAESGYAGTELGPVGYFDSEKLGGHLDKLNLQLVAGNIFEKLHEPAEVPAILEKVHASCRILKQHGGKFFVIVPHVAPERIATTGRSADAPRLPEHAWKQFMEAIKQVAEITKSYGIQCTLHPHAGCWLEYEDEVERALAELPAELVGLCLDTGHFTYAGMNPVEKYQKHASRIPYMHFKDIDGKVLDRLRQEKLGFWDGIKSGVFCPLGQGLVNFPAFLRAMKAHGFAGWVTVEQDADNSITDAHKKLMVPFECCKLNVKYLQSLGVVSGKTKLGAGNLAHYDDTWHIVRDGDTVPPTAVMSSCRVDPSASEYDITDGSQCGGQLAWWSKSDIAFEYRVVEVPNLLDPSNDALLFGHLKPGSAERDEAMKRDQRRLVVIDATVDELYGKKVSAYFEERGVRYEMLRLPMTEENKTMDVTLEVCKKMKKFNIDRRTEPVIAIGGGVCLDVVGLAASMFRRRTPYIRIPTTALSYVDASVGAKNGCNFAGSKNRLGTYVPPVAALLDSSFIKTEEARAISNGLGEMCKMAIMKSKDLFELLENNAQRLIEDRFQARDAADSAPARVLRLSIETMLEELSPNLWENSLDRLVDFGHAVGQNLEMSALGTKDELMHGEAVACDMAFSSVMACLLGLITEEERDRIHRLLKTCKLPVHSPAMTPALLKESLDDRVKNSMGQRFPLPKGIGKAGIFNDVSDEIIQKAYKQWQELCA